MKWQSALAIYLLFWALSVFFVLPFGVRTAAEAGTELVPGQAESAPAHFDARKVALRVTIVATVLFGIFYLNYVMEWVTVADFDWMHGN
jgi:predicted secreted protein